MKRCLTSLAIKKMQIKTTIRYYLTATGMDIFFKKKEQKVTGVSEDAGKLEPSYIVGRNVKRHSCCKNSLAVPQKVKHRITI